MPELSKIKDRDTGVEYDVKDAQARKEIAALKENENGNNSGGNVTQGLTSAQISALDGMFQIASFTADPTAAYAAFKTAFGITDSGEETPDAPTDEPVIYTITRNLSGVTCDNLADSVQKNSNYRVTLTAQNEMVLDVVTVTMGGTDVTSGVYNNGVITIASVTGDIVITANAREVASSVCILSNIGAQAESSTNGKMNLTFSGFSVVPIIMTADFDTVNLKTALSGKTITKILVKVHTAGTLTVGKVDLTTFGTRVNPEFTDYQEFTVTAGLNTIAVNLTLGATETLGFQTVNDTALVAYAGSRDDQMSFTTADHYRSGTNDKFSLYGEIYGKL